MTPKPETSIISTPSQNGENATTETVSPANRGAYTNAAFESDVSNRSLRDVVLTSLSDTPKSVEPAPAARMDFDDLLPHIGEFGRYQKILFLLMIPFTSFVAFTYFTQIFITIVPEQHWCRIPELEHLTAEERYVEENIPHEGIQYALEILSFFRPLVLTLHSFHSHANLYAKLFVVYLFY